jgi:protoporphyrinogen/coproporphyrinogen III oxidase
VTATAPMIDAARRRGRLTPALRAQRKRAQATGPVFMTVRGGLSRLVGALADGLGERIRTATPAVGLRATDTGWDVDTPQGTWAADHVVVALPAQPAAALLATAAADAARALRTFDTASVAVVALAYDHADVAGLPEGSGFLVPRTEGRLVKAATWSSRKWPHLADAERFVLRASVGRVDDPRGLDLDDDALAARVDAEVREATGITGPAREHRVIRWHAAMPQYDVSHHERVERVRSALGAGPAGLHVGGAALDGVGLPARVQDATRLADEVLAAAGVSRSG